MRSIFVPLRLDANARGLQLETSMDPRIDEVAHRLALVDEEANLTVEEGDGLVMGDEMRLRQSSFLSLPHAEALRSLADFFFLPVSVLHNLASNACKFTPTGGKITIRTILIYPGVSETSASTAKTSVGDLCAEDRSESTYSPRLSVNKLQQHEAIGKPSSTPEVVVVRIEVEDTGVGIKPKDMADSRLFSACRFFYPNVAH